MNGYHIFTFLSKRSNLYYLHTDKHSWAQLSRFHVLNQLVAGALAFFGNVGR
jgi:hypothetical protein